MHSKYYKSWEERRKDLTREEIKREELMRPKLQPYEEMVFRFVISLLM